MSSHRWPDYTDKARCLPSEKPVSADEQREVDQALVRLKNGKVDKLVLYLRSGRIHTERLKRE